MPNFHGKKLAGMFLVILCLLGIQACGGGGGSTGGGGGSTTTTSFEGIIAGSNDVTGQTGVMSVTVQTAVAKSSPFSFIKTAYASSDTVTGTLTIANGGGAVDLTGAYDSSTGELSLTGAGGYTFTGTITGDVMSGNYTSTGADTGGGFAGLNSTTNTVKVFCGTFENGTDDSSGLFNLAVTDSVLSGVRINYTRRNIYRTLSGTRTGDTLDAVVDDTGRRGTGTITGDDVAGTFVNGDGETGTFAGSVSECQ